MIKLISNSQMLRAAIALVVLASSAAAAADDPDITVNAMSVLQANQAQTSFLANVPQYEDKVLQEYVSQLGQKLAAEAPSINVEFEFVITDDPRYYALSMANGFIVVSRGLMYYMNSEAQLAFVLGHEIGHVLSLHREKEDLKATQAAALARRLSNRFDSEQAQELIDTLRHANERGYSREQEVEADVWGEKLLKANGYMTAESIAALGFFAQLDAFSERFGGFDSHTMGLENTGIFATHPSGEQRVELAKKRQGRAGRKPVPPDNAYLQKLDGVVFGMSATEGVQRNDVFTSFKHSLSVTVPKRWLVDTSAQDSSINLISPEENALITFRLHEAENKSAQEKLLEVERVEAIDFRGPETATDTAFGIASHNGNTVILGVIDFPKQRVLCAGSSENLSSEEQESLLAQIKSTIASLRSTLNQASPEPLRVRLGEVTVEGLPVSAWQVDEQDSAVRVLNQAYPNKVLETGQTLKIIR